MSRAASTARRRRPLTKAQIRRRRVPRIPDPLAVERDYARRLLVHIDPARLAVEKLLMPKIEELAAAARADGVGFRLDRRVEDELGRIIRGVKIAYAARVSTDPSKIASTYGQTTARLHERGFRRQIESVLRVDPRRAEPWLTGALKQFERDNVKLIKSIPETYFDQVESVVRDSLDNGRRVEKIAGIIEQRFDVTRNRAKLIATDQIQKLHGQLTETRQQRLGVRKYKWRHSRDERVRGNPSGLYPHARHSHWHREGKIYLWSEPPEDGHPGVPIRCRCHAEPYFEDDIDFLNIGGSDPIEPRQPRKRKPRKRKASPSRSRDPVGPFARFSRKRLDNAAAELASNPTAEAQRAVRREMNTLLAKEGLVSRDIVEGKPARAQITSRYEGPGVLGSYAPKSGRINLSPKTTRDLGSRNPEIRRKALHTVMHESVHAHSPMTYGVYNGVGMALEEATTETLARAMVQKHLRPDQYSPDDVWSVEGAYPRWVDKLRDGVAETLGIGTEAASARVIEAARKMRAYKGKAFEDPDSYLLHFARQFPEARKFARDAQARASRSSSDDIESSALSRWSAPIREALRGSGFYVRR